MRAPRAPAPSRRKALALALALALLQTVAAQQCTSDNVVSVMLNFNTNSTGHPQLNARLEQPTATPAWQVSLQVGTTRCGGGAPAVQVLTLALHGGGPPQPPASPAPPGYRTLAGLGHYRVAGAGAALEWAGARRQCAQEGAALAVLTSRREAELLSRDFAFNASGAQHGHLAWLAASDAAQEGAWLTTAGLPLEETGYVKWHPSEPNGGNKENCLALTKADGFFIDANCAWKLSYICKMPL